LPSPRDSTVARQQAELRRLPVAQRESLPVNDNSISILDGSTFLVSSPNGDIDAKPDQPQGLFFKDMRHLSKWKLTVNGITVLSTDSIE